MTSAPPNREPARRANNGLVLPAALLCAAVPAFLLAFLTRNMAVRPAWVVGLLTAIPGFAAMLGAALAGGNFSGGKALLALGVAPVIFGLGFGGDTLFRSTHSAGQATGDVVIVMDKSGDMTSYTDSWFVNPDEAAGRGVAEALKALPAGTRVGLVLCAEDVLYAAEPAFLTQTHKNELAFLAALPAVSGGTFRSDYALTEAQSLAGSARIVLLTTNRSVTDFVRKPERLTVLAVKDAPDTESWIAEIKVALAGNEEDLFRCAGTEALPWKAGVLVLAGLILGFALSRMAEGRLWLGLILSVAAMAAACAISHFGFAPGKVWPLEGLALTLTGIAFGGKTGGRKASSAAGGGSSRGTHPPDFSFGFDNGDNGISETEDSKSLPFGGSF